MSSDYHVTCNLADGADATSSHCAHFNRTRAGRMRFVVLGPIAAYGLRPIVLAGYADVGRFGTAWDFDEGYAQLGTLLQLPLQRAVEDAHRLMPRAQ